MDFGISTAYLDNARECVTKAEKADDEPSKLFWHRFAAAWLRLSDQVEESEAQAAALILPLIH